MLAANTIHNMDCIQGMQMLPNASVHCCVTSPPYWGLRDYSIKEQYGLEPTPEEYVQNMVTVFKEVKRILKPEGTVWLNIGDAYSGSGKAGAEGPYREKHTEFGKPSTHASRFGRPTTGKHPDHVPALILTAPGQIRFILSLTELLWENM